MNIIHMRYAVEVARVGSINKASENLNMAQPNISRAIKDLESDLGIAIFDRSAKGMNLTPEGKTFIHQAQEILAQLDNLESLFKDTSTSKKSFTVCVPRSGYISQAFVALTKEAGDNRYELVMNIADANGTVKQVVTGEAKIGIIRYDTAADRYFKELLSENALVFDVIKEFEPVLLMNKSGVLADKDEILKSDLEGLIQVTHRNPYAATLTLNDAHKETVKEDSLRCVYTQDSATQLETLAQNTDAYMWVASLPQELLDRHGLVQKRCADASVTYKDVLIYKKDARFGDTEKRFISLIMA